MGDGLLVYFGYPRAHEDDAERAVRAGLHIVDAVGRLDVKSVKLEARVGIATGLVVVGDLIGEGSAREQSVVGGGPQMLAGAAAAGAPAGSLRAPAIAQGIKELNMVTSWPKDFPGLQTSAERLARSITAMSD